LADADAEAQVQAVEQYEPRPPVAPVAQERLKEMALALSVRERPGQPGAPAESPVPESAAQASGGEAAPSGAAAVVRPTEAQPTPAPTGGDPEASGRTVDSSSVARRDRLVLPKASADQVVQALAIGGLARRRNRVATWAAAASAAEGAGRSAPVPADDNRPQTAASPSDRRDAPGVASGAVPPDAGEANGGNGASAEDEADPQAKSGRRGRKPKHQGLPEGWVIDEEGFVVPG
jgi:hypothetical protein